MSSADGPGGSGGCPCDIWGVPGVALGVPGVAQAFLGVPDESLEVSLDTWGLPGCSSQVPRRSFEVYGRSWGVPAGYPNRFVMYTVDLMLFVRGHGAINLLRVCK